MGCRVLGPYWLRDDLIINFIIEKRGLEIMIKQKKGKFLFLSKFWMRKSFIYLSLPLSYVIISSPSTNTGLCPPPQSYSCLVSFLVSPNLPTKGHPFDIPPPCLFPRHQRSSPRFETEDLRMGSFNRSGHSPHLGVPTLSFQDPEAPALPVRLHTSCTHILIPHRHWHWLISRAPDDFPYVVQKTVFKRTVASFKHSVL